MFWFTIVREEDLDMLRKVAQDAYDEADRQADRAHDAMSKLESEIADLTYVRNGLQDELNRTRAELAYRDIMQEDLRNIDFSVLSSANPKLLDELFTLVKICQQTIIAQSLKIRKVEGIAYRDGAVDGLEILKSKLKEFYRAVSKKGRMTKENPEESE